MNNNVKFNNLKSDFKSCTQVLTAIGDETRQVIIVVLAEIIYVRKVRTMNYYYLSPSSKLMNLKKLINSIEKLINDNEKK